jgi:outer membrane lipopolysaccharide assembly protein LptE/RlpB
VYNISINNKGDFEMTARIVKIEKMNTDNTKEIRRTLKENGIKVSQCRLGSNRYYLLLHTSDNYKASEILAKHGYTQRIPMKNSALHQSTNMMMEKVTI